MIILFLIIIRIIELSISKKNEKWLRENGALEYGKEHYKYIIAIHVMFYISLIVESKFVNIDWNNLNLIFLVFFILLQIGRIWVIVSLGKYWNTKILRIPNSLLIKKGPYKYFKHPNYVIVVLEILVIPLMFNLYYTAVIFTILNSIILYIRIKEENKSLNL